MFNPQKHDCTPRRSELKEPLKVALRLQRILDYDFVVSIAYKMLTVEPRNMSTEHKLPRHVSRLITWSKRRGMDSEITYQADIRHTNGE